MRLNPDQHCWGELCGPAVGHPNSCNCNCPECRKADADLLDGSFSIRARKEVSTSDLLDYHEQVLVSLLYQLGRDHLALGELEQLLRSELHTHRDDQGNRRSVAYSNKHLHAYVKEWARKILAYPTEE